MALLGSGDKTKNSLDGMWLKCNNCGEIVYRKEVEKNLKVCPKCNYHFRLSAKEWINILIDDSTFHELWATMESTDPLDFRDKTKYRDRLKETIKQTELKDAVITGYGTINGLFINIGIFDFDFMGGSMGSVVGEKITRLIEKTTEEQSNLVVITSSGGARMQESIYSLMQMAKTNAALNRLNKTKALYISLLTDPTTGGVAASFASIADIMIAEPRALIGFAGPRVISDTLSQKLPEGFQRAEFLLEHGMIDMVVERKVIKKTITQLIRLTGNIEKKLRTD
ncbi:MAG: acetyl-CoA carboxylase, carboxyltransferase subunit beta [Deltaproteobacteria bacterium]|nr:acetyl-CoA carboxylase, carboxyltransferase subunit beta [Deltaproteobacteria bacterium]MCL5792411.1 acetyl-CoA carboxylase, carboxyltransferase subunit beta [Deltaproteobacteria bacterium]